MIAKSAATASGSMASTDEPSKEPKAVASTDKIKENKTHVPKIGATSGTKRRHALRYMPAGKKSYPSAFEKLNRPVLAMSTATPKAPHNRHYAQNETANEPC